MSTVNIERETEIETEIEIEPDLDLDLESEEELDLDLESESEQEELKTEEQEEHERFNKLAKDLARPNETLVLRSWNLLPTRVDIPYDHNFTEIDLSLKEFWIRLTTNFILFHSPMITVNETIEEAIDILKKLKESECGVILCDPIEANIEDVYVTLNFTLPFDQRGSRDLKNHNLSTLLDRFKKVFF